MFLLGMILFLSLVGCGKEDITLKTTENINNESTNEPSTTSDIAPVQVMEATTEYVNIEEASEEDKQITLQQIYVANNGDALLVDNDGYSVNTVYYADGTEIYSELQYMGFDSDGMYMQAYEDSEGYVEILDSVNMCWYVVEDESVSTVLYPEEGMAAVTIDYTHNNMVMANPKDGEATITKIYRADGYLVVEVDAITEYDEKLQYKYVMEDDYRILECSCYEEGELVSYYWTTTNAVYNEPELITQIKQNSDKRLITVGFPDGSGIEYIYQVPKEYPVSIKIFGSVAYSDIDCTREWNEISPMTDGNYADENIFLIRK